MRILALDYGLQRCGLAWTDPGRTLALPLDPCRTADLQSRLDACIDHGEVDTLVVGLPRRLSGEETHLTQYVHQLAGQLKLRYPNIVVELADERYTSRLAEQSMVMSGASKKEKRDKMTVNSVSAVIILQDYLASRR